MSCFLSVQTPAMAAICIMTSSLQDNSTIQMTVSNFISLYPYHIIYAQVQSLLVYLTLWHIYASSYYLTTHFFCNQTHSHMFNEPKIRRSLVPIVLSYCHANECTEFPFWWTVDFWFDLLIFCCIRYLCNDGMKNSITPLAAIVTPDT